MSGLPVCRHCGRQIEKDEQGRWGDWWPGAYAPSPVCTVRLDYPNAHQPEESK